MFKEKLIERGILELCPIVTANSFQVVRMLNVQPQSQAPKVFKHFILTFQEENPSTSYSLLLLWLWEPHHYITSSVPAATVKSRLMA
jgi:hypothetical protein